MSSAYPLAWAMAAGAAPRGTERRLPGSGDCGSPIGYPLENLHGQLELQYEPLLELERGPVLAMLASHGLSSES